MTASSGARLRVAVVGGGIGTQHIDALIRLPEQFELVAFCDIDPAKAEAVADRYDVGSTPPPMTRFSPATTSTSSTSARPRACMSPRPK